MVSNIYCTVKYSTTTQSTKCLEGTSMIFLLARMVFIGVIVMACDYMSYKRFCVLTKF